MKQNRPETVPTRKRVAIIGTRGYPSYYGGFETAVRHLSPFLADRGWDVTVYGRAWSTKDDDPERDPRVTSIKTRGIESKSLSTLSYGLTSTIHAVRQNFDVVIVMNVANGFWLPLLRMRGIPSLVNVDGIEWDRAKWGAVAKAMFRAGAKLTAWFATNLVFDAKEIARRWNDDFDRQGEFIPYGGKPSLELPLEPGLTHRGYVLVVARFVPENSVPEFLAAAKDLSKDWPVVVVGSGGYGGELDLLAQRLDDENPNVRWFGHVSDDDRLHSLWQHAGAYFHGHSVGGTNPALVQAMALGAPTVARDTVYNREVLGEGGMFTEPTSEAIGFSIRQLMGDQELQSQLSEDAIRRAESVYSWDFVCSRYESAIDELSASGSAA